MKRAHTLPHVHGVENGDPKSIDQSYQQFRHTHSERKNPTGPKKSEVDEDVDLRFGGPLVWEVDLVLGAEDA